MPYTHITGGQDMEQEPSDDLVGTESHRFLPVSVGIIPP